MFNNNQTRITITCFCGKTREIMSNLAKSVTRCKDCQKKYAQEYAIKYYKNKAQNGPK